MSPTTPVLVQSRVTLAAGVSSFLLGASLVLLSVLPSAYVPHWIERGGPGIERALLAGGSGLFALLGAFLTATYFLERHELSAHGITSRSVFGLSKAVEWSDLRSVQYCPYPRAWFRLHSNSGTVVRLSFSLQGLPEFARLALHGAPVGSIEETTAAVLRSVASGHHPPMRLGGSPNHHV
jgi:hypothetical protein